MMKAIGGYFSLELPFLKGNNYVCEDKKEQPKQKLLVFENNDVNICNSFESSY